MYITIGEKDGHAINVFKLIAEAVHDCKSLNIATQEVHPFSQQDPL